MLAWDGRSLNASGLVQDFSAFKFCCARQRRGLKLRAFVFFSLPLFLVCIVLKTGTPPLLINISQAPRFLFKTFLRSWSSLVALLPLQLSATWR